MSTALETNAQRIHQDAVLTEMREEFGGYFRALEAHPRTLVGQTVPSMTGEGTEVLRDSQDAADWQSAAKTVLTRELASRTDERMEADASTLTLLHSSVELFQNNADLVPGTRGFDAELASEFVRFAKPYEHRSEGKLIGYNIPVQPLLDQVREGLRQRRAAAAAQAKAPAAPAQAAPGRPAKAAPAPAPAEASSAPQAGISSKAGASGNEAQDFSVLFGTLGPGFEGLALRI